MFTLGQSHLSDDHQHFFFIRNDAIVTVNAGREGQSAVICQSGRCFVWGTNENGELGIGESDETIITKPTCIKDLKNLGYKITKMVFGKGFSVIVTLDNRIFFSGRNILPTNFLCSLKQSPLANFSTPLSMTEDINSDLSEVSHVTAGTSHFAVITGGKILINNFSYNKLSNIASNCGHKSPRIDPHLINFRIPDRPQRCSKKKTLTSRISFTLLDYLGPNSR